MLLDTHAILWLDSGTPMTPEAVAAIEVARLEGGVLVSPISAWEIGLLVRKRRIALDVDPVAWFQRFLGIPGVRLTPLSVEAAAGSSLLPEPFHGDPGDRMITATAQTLSIPLVTRDRAIREFAALNGTPRIIVC
nr:type II toxin-antitoxin system VapC family toxin [Azospirillum rugosum]